MRILIADDDATSRKMLAAVLKKAGHEVLETVDGVQAWEALQQPDAPRLAILDWMMPEMDGLQVLGRVRALSTDQPPYIIMLTAKTEKADIISGLDAGANDYLAKPFDSGELHARVEVGRRMVALQKELARSREHLAHQAAHDPLTGLPNRRSMLAQLNEELARCRRHSDVLSVGMCDIDHFKSVNDAYGHLTGDDVLCELGLVLTGCCRSYDSIGRVGGEEFLIIAPMQAGAEAGSLYNRIRASVAEAKLATRVGALSITVSIGAAFADGMKTTDDLVAAADAALYRAKAEGRNRVVFAGENAMKPAPHNPAEAS